MKLKLSHFALTAVALGLQTAPASAHLVYKGSIPIKTTTSKLTGKLVTPTGEQGISRGDWSSGTKWGMYAMGQIPTLIRFHLDQDAIINLSVAPTAVPDASSTPKDHNTWLAASMDTAFSLYQGLLPYTAMDHLISEGIYIDTIDIGPGAGPYQSNFSGQYWGDYYVWGVSAWDAAPNDPAIPQLIGQLDADTGLPVVDPTYGSLLLSVNPDWNSRSLAEMAQDPKYADNSNLQALLADEGELTPKQWYAKHYTPHNGYRDTLNFTGRGEGIVVPGDPRIEQGAMVGAVPGYWPFIFPDTYQAFAWRGEIDPLGDFSLSNEDAASHPDTAATQTNLSLELNPAGVDWAKIYHVGHANAWDSETYTAADGSQRPAPNLSAERLHNQLLAKGDYTLLIADGCGQCVDDLGDILPNDPVVSGEVYSGLNINLQAWPTKDCSLSKNANAGPEIAPVSGPWDVVSGQSISIPLVAHACGSNAPTFKARGLTGATLATATAVNDRLGKLDASSNQPLQLGWQSQLNWTADSVTKVTTRTVKITAGNGKKTSKTQTAKLRIWPAGSNPGNSFELQPPEISWKATSNDLTIKAKVKLKNTQVLLPEEKAAIMGMPLRLIGTESGNGVSADGTVSGGPLLDNKGQIKYSTKLDATNVPCKVQWVFGHVTGLATVANAPGNCVQ